MTRSRNKDGRFRRKRSDTHLETLKETYNGSIPKGAPKKHLGQILKETGETSFSDLLNK